MQYLRLLLLPFSLIYGSIIWLRNKGYDLGVFSSRKFNIPVIGVGNLAIGGAGKSPMAEYLIRLLSTEYRIAILSRGYGRVTKGFRLVEASDTSSESGDEPLQFRKKFEDITVAVSESRVVGIEELQGEHDVIILDDAFQHRAVKPGLSILLFDYTRLNNFFLMLPAGNLREPFANRLRADILVVSKCPQVLTSKDREVLRKRLRPLKHQQLFFSYLDYGNLIPLASGEEKPLSSISQQSAILLLTGIANPWPLVQKLESFATTVIHHDYPDHHTFSLKNIAKLADEFQAISIPDKIIVTTEKDAQRLQAPALLELLSGLPVYYLPVAARIHQPDADGFNMLIQSYVTRSIQHNTIHKKQNWRL